MPPQAAPRRELRVFVSSTFRDLREEREYLAKVAFPKVRELCEARGVTFVDVDLRWGISEEQANTEGTLTTCLAEIDNCHPFFIGILAERYGWVPPKFPDRAVDRNPWLSGYKGRSVTELEITHRLLKAVQTKNAVGFYFRDPAYLKRLPAGANSADFVSDNSGDAAKLAALKKRVRASGYPVRENFKTPQQLGDLIVTDLAAALDTHFPTPAAGDASEQEALRQMSFVQQRAQGYVERKPYAQRVSSHIDGAKAPLVVSGVQGAGKSSLLATAGTARAKAHPNDIVIASFAGTTSAAGDLDAMLLHVVRRLKSALALDREVPIDAGQLRADFAGWLATVSLVLQDNRNPRRLVVIIDGVDELRTHEGVADISWLPGTLPPGVALLISAAPGEVLQDLRRQRLPELPLEPLAPGERAQIAKTYLNYYGKALPDDQLKRITDAAQSASPLFLRTVLEELRLHGDHVSVGERLAHYLAAADVVELYGKILERDEKDYQSEWPELVRDAMAALHAARNGLTENELLALLGGDRPMPRAYWSALHLALSSALVNHDGLLVFGHDALRQAVGRRYLASGDDERRAHEKLAAFFGNRASPVVERRRLDELSWHLARAGNWAAVGTVMSDPAYLNRAWTTSQNDVLAMLGEYETGSRRSVAELFAPVVTAPSRFAVVHVGAVAQILVRGFDMAGGTKLQDHLIERMRAEGSADDLATALNNRALTLADSGAHDRALAMHEEQGRILERQGDRFGAEMAIIHRARVLMARGDVDAAKTVLEKLVAQAKDQRAIVTALAFGMLGDIDRHHGRLGEARGKYEKLAAFSRRANHLPGMMEAATSFAEIAAQEKDFATATARADEALKLARRMGDAIYEANALATFARVAYEQGDPAGALRYYGEAEAIYAERKTPAPLALLLANKGTMLTVLRRFSEATVVLQHAEALSREVNDRRTLMLALAGQGIVKLEIGSNKEAYRLFSEQADIARAQGHYAGLRAALGNMTLAAARANDAPAALAALDEEIALCRAHGDVADLRELEAKRRSVVGA